MAKKPKQKSPGDIRRTHDGRKPGKRKKPKLSIVQRLGLVNKAMEKAIADTDCEELDAICAVVTKWAAELTVVHHPEISDDAIDRATIMFPDEPLTRIIHSVAVLHANNQHLTPDAVADFVVDKLAGRELSIPGSQPYN